MTKTRDLPRANPLLQRALAGLCKEARSNPGRPARHTFAGGLQVDALYKDGAWSLQISRDDAPPLDTEWASILAYWPELVPEVEFRRFVWYGRHYVRSRWPDAAARK